LLSSLSLLFATQAAFLNKVTTIKLYLNFPSKASITSITHGKKRATDTGLIVNPHSASGSTGKDWDNLYGKIKDSFGQKPKVVFTNKPGHGTSLARNQLKKRFKNISSQ
jgi:hypothetical protein